MGILNSMGLKRTEPTNDDFDDHLLRCKSIYHILNDNFALVDYSYPDDTYYRVYRNGDPVSAVCHVDKENQVPYHGEHIDVHQQQLAPPSQAEIKEIAEGKRHLDNGTLDKLLRQKQNLEQITSGKLTAIITYSDKPGYSRLYPMLKGAFMLGVDHLVTVENDAATAGLWVFAQQQTGSVNYNVVDLRNEI